MPAITATAPGKIILFGEHAVVYGRPAIAAPVPQVRARAAVSADPQGTPGRIILQAPDISLSGDVADLQAEQPLAYAIRLALEYLELPRVPACTVRVTSNIPISAGMGSGAAASVALLRAFSAFVGQPLNDEAVNELAYEVEKLHHGTPSGVDNTVVTYNMPVYFVRGQPIKRFFIARPFTIVIGDTGIPSATAQTVGDVRQRWEAEAVYYDALFDHVANIAEKAHQHIEIGEVEALGPLMDANQSLLEEMGVSSPELERLIAAARAAGAWGAKLSGGGGGGNMIALAGEGAARQSAERIAAALEEAGAKRALIAHLS